MGALDSQRRHSPPEALEALELPGPSRRIVVEPLRRPETTPAPAPEPRPAEEPAQEPLPSREPAPKEPAPA